MPAGRGAGRVHQWIFRCGRRDGARAAAPLARPAGGQGGVFLGSRGDSAAVRGLHRGLRGARQPAAPGRPALSDRRRSGRRAGRALVPEDPGEGAASDPRRRDFGGRGAADRMLTFLGAILAGLVCGVLSGFGIGGGSLLMVWMTAVLSMDQKAAQGVNLLYFLPCAACALIFHIKNRQIVWPAVWPAAAAGAVCAVGGALLAQQADAETLRKLFGGFLILVGLSEVFLKGLKKK